MYHAILLAQYEVSAAPLEPVSSSNGGSWLVIAIVIAAWFVIRAGMRSAEKSRMKFSATDRKRCPHCRSAHPGFASFCRQCGARF